MTSVKNKKVIRLLSKRTLHARKRKNIIAVLAIALTAVLFTTIFTIGGSLLKSNTESSLRQVGGKTHAGFKYFTWEEYEKLKQDSKIRDLSYNVIVGMGMNPELNKIQCEVRYFEDEAAKDAFSYPTTGTTPKKMDEIAMSTIVLDALGIPHKLGETVNLTMEIHQEEVSRSFTLCGFWEGDKALQAQEVLVSKEYADCVAPVETIPVYEKEESDYSGYMDVNFNFSNSWDIEGKMQALCERVGFDTSKVSYGVNWAYGFSSIDPATMAMIVVVLLLIMLSGYLIIYNIFYLNIYADIQFYGLLKTVGTTGKQLRNIVRRQAWILCLYGIPGGLLAGWATGAILTPVVMKTLTLDTLSLSVNPLIFAGAAVFTAITVHVSCIKPCRIAAKVSPVEAVKYTEKQKGIRKKRTNKTTPFHMASANIKRYPKKLILVILSLGLSLTLLNSVYTIVTGFDMDKYLENYMVSDYSVSDASLTNFATTNTNYAGVTKEFQQELAEQEGAENIGNVYIKQIEHQLSDKEFEILKTYMNRYSESLSESYEKEETERIKKNKTHYIDIYGVNEAAAKKIVTSSEPIDWDKFSTGQYVIVNGYYESEMTDLKNPYLNPSDTVTLETGTGELKTYEVLAVGTLPYALQSQHYFSCMPTAYILPETEFLASCGDIQPMRTIFDAKEGQSEEVTEWLKNYCEKVNTNLLGESIEDYFDMFEDLKRVYTLTGGFLSFVLGMIGVLNFVNVTITAILSRKRELAMMEAIGMTGKQQMHMLQFEGMDYALLTLLVTCTAGMGIGYFIANLIAGEMPIFTWHFTMLPVAVCAPFLLLISIIVPSISYKSSCRSTVVERLRIHE